MTDKQCNTEFPWRDRISVILFAIFFGLYILNVLIGKAIIVFEWNFFHFGNVGEFLILLAASVAFVVTALHQEAVCNSNRNPDKT